MNKRIKALRKSLDLTQQEFADKIGLKRNTIANYEIGRNTPIDAVIVSICREFKVSESWLRTGEGAMFRSESPDEKFLCAANSIASGTDEMDAIVRRLLTYYFEMDERKKKALLTFVKGIAEEERK